MRGTGTVGVVVVRSLALVAAAVVLWRGVTQGIDALVFWSPCYQFGFNAAPCSRLQYEVSSPAWAVLFALWPIMLALSIVVLAASLVVRHRRALALAGAIAVVLSHPIVDHVATPMINGGYISADNHPGSGFIGAGLLIAAGVLFVLVGVTPRRPVDAVAVRRSTLRPPSEPSRLRDATQLHT